MIFRTVCLGLVFYVGHCSASELMVYRWVAKNNVVHFSQHQPVGDEYTEFLVSNQSKIISRADPVVIPLDSDKKVVLKKEEEDIPSTINMTENCKEAEANLSMLMAFDKVQYTDESGVTQILSKQEKQQQLEINKKRAEVYCASIDDEN
jgi:hypothetical protein